MATLLIFDTTGAACSVAVWSAQAVIANRYEAMPRGQAEHLLPMIGATLNDAGLDYAQLEAVAVTTGPGAFTGVRIGLSAARGLALALDIPALGVTAFEAMAIRAPTGCLVAIDTKRRDYYCQTFDPDCQEATILSAEALLDQVAALGTRLVTDDPALAERAGDAAAGIAARPPDAVEFARLAAERFAAGRAGHRKIAPPRPYYMRAPEARLPEKSTERSS